MLILKTIENKRTIKLPDYDQEITELLEPSIIIKSQLKVDNIISVPKSLEGRPWAISKLYYGDESFADLLCFFNNIPLGFMLKEGTKLFIYNLQSMLDQLVDNTSLNNKNVAKEELNKRLPERDKNRFKRLIKQETGKDSDLATPNLADGPQLTIDGGSIVFGTNVSDSKCRVPLSSTQTKSEALRNFVKEKYMDPKP